MKALKAVLADRRRSQRGSVLSGVLIIVMFLSILAGALMTELSSNFLLSHALVVRATNQATVNSSIELALDTLQTADMTSACPGLTQVPLNGQTATATYLSCALVVSKALLPAVQRIPTPSGRLDIDGAYVSLPSLPTVGNSSSHDEYLIADSAGTLFAYPFGESTTRWSFSLGGTPTAPPLAMDGGGGEISDLVPVRYGSPANYAVALLQERQPGGPPLFNCYLDANARVTTAPAPSRTIRKSKKHGDSSGSVYFGDESGTVFAYNATAGGDCSIRDTFVLPGKLPVVAGPLVIPETNSHTDDLYLVGSDGSSSKIFHLRYNSNNETMSLVSGLSLPAGNAVGMAVDDDRSIPTTPRIAITFAGGQLSLVQLDTGYNMSRVTTAAVLVAGVANAPAWCQSCDGGRGVIGLVGTTGLYLFDSALKPHGNFTFLVPRIHSTPVVNAGGDWFVTDGYTLDELQRPANQPAMVLAKRFIVGNSSVTSSPVMHQCTADLSAFPHPGLCIYFAADSKTYLVSLDAHEAVITACITSPGPPTTCTSDRPRAWASVEVTSTPAQKVLNAPQPVHILGWSYYSP